jgi:hypothetical protein
MMKRKRARLFHTLVVLGSTMAVPALAVSAAAAIATLVAGCDDGGTGTASPFDEGTPRDMSHNG